MSRVTLFSLFKTRIAYPSAAFTTPDMRSMLGLYAFASSTAAPAVPSRGLLALSDDVVTLLHARDELG